MDKLKENNRIAYLDYLRILAALAIVFIHMSAQNWYGESYTSSNFHIMLVYDCLSVWGVPVFVMISGALFLSRDISVKKIYTKNILRLLCAFIFWGIVYVLLAGKLPVKEIVLGIVYGHYHMWFILMIIGLYMATPILREVVKSETLTKYYLIISGLITIVIPTLITMAIVFNIPYFLTIQEIFNRNLTAMEFPSFLGYSFFYVLGHYINNKTISRKSEITIYVLSIVALVATYFLSIAASIHYETPATNFIFYKTINVAIYSVGIFVFFKNHCNKTFKLTPMLIYISSCTFGIYLIHLKISELFNQYFGINTLSMNPIITIPLLSVLYFLISLGVVAIIKLIPIAKKYIV